MIRLEGLTRYYFRDTSNEVKALDDLSLELRDGDFITLIGSNGAGKSTLLKAVAGAVEVDEGRIEMDGRDVARLPEYQRAGVVGRVDQDPMASTASLLTVEENLAMAAMRGRPRLLGRAVTLARRANFRGVLAEVGLGLEDRLQVRVGTLSGGQRQALALVMATIARPRLLLLDEHTAALDPRTAGAVMEITNSLVVRHHLTTLMVTHNMEQAIRWGNRLVMMHRGRVIMDIAGEEKQRLTVPQLIEKFGQVSGSAFDDDRVLLA